VKEKDNRARIKLEDGSVINCTEKQILAMVELRVKARMDITPFVAAYFELTGTPLPER